MHGETVKSPYIMFIFILRIFSYFLLHRHCVGSTTISSKWSRAAPNLCHTHTHTHTHALTRTHTRHFLRDFHFPAP